MVQDTVRHFLSFDKRADRPLLPTACLVRMPQCAKTLSKEDQSEEMLIINEENIIRHQSTTKRLDRMTTETEKNTS